MFNNLPEEIIKIIIEKGCDTPKDYIYFKNINKSCSLIIDSFEDLYDNKENTYEVDINEFCNKRTPVNTFQWFFKNKVDITLLNIKQLIIHNRTDVFQRGLFYKYFLNILFNRFYMNADIHNDIFSMVESINPLIVSGSYNRIEIIKLLIEKSTTGNPYLKMIPDLLDISIKYNHKNLLSYLVINQYESIQMNIDSKLISIIHRIDNCEDILFYLLLNNKIKIYSKHLQGIILRNYNSLFNYWYKMTSYRYTFYITLMSHCIVYNNIAIFNILFENKDVKNNLSKKEFTKLLFENRDDNFYMDKKLFIQNILNNYKNQVDYDSPFVNICILNNIEEDSIIELVRTGYTFTEDDMKLVLEDKKLKLLEKMCHICNNK